MSAADDRQVINLDELDEPTCVHIRSRNVVVHPSSNTVEGESKASNKITTKNVVDYSWEDRYSLGHLISYHQYTELIAYVLSISNSYMIRVLNESNSSRCLIKDFSGDLTDIAFSKSRLPYLASIDINGFVKVNKIIINEEILEPQLILHIRQSIPTECVKPSKICYSRVMWCSHTDYDESALDEVEATGTNISLLLGLVHGSMFEVLQIDTIETELQSQAELDQYEPKIDRATLRSISSGFQEQFINSESLSDLFLPYLYYSATGTTDESRIISLAISNDAAAFAISLRDGTVRFFTLDGSSPTGLKEAYSWKPFETDAAWSLLFLDDCRAGSKIDSYWCHVVVGGSFNRQLKLFRCDKWDCIQTISFESPILPCLMTAHLDQSANFLIMSDIRRKAIYVLELDSIDNGKTKLFKSVQEFVLSQPLLSFDINYVSVEAAGRKLTDQFSTMNVIDDSGNHVVIKLYVITKAAFQKMRISYISRGHHLDEILVEDPDSEFNNIAEKPPPLVTSSILTQVSSLPSVASSFQDPAIVSTQLLGTGSILPQPTVPSDVPPVLKHLFSNAIGVKGTKGASSFNNDSGDESGDEASLEDDMAMPRDPTEMIDELCRNNVEETGFPLPPCAVNSMAWNGPVTMNGTKSLAGESTARPNDHNPDELSNSIGRLESIIISQQAQIELLTKSIGELTTEVRGCSCRELRQQWSDRCLRELNEASKRNIIECVIPSLKEQVDMSITRLSDSVSNKVGGDVRSRMTALETVVREFLNNLFHDKKFVGFLSNGLAESIEKPLRAAYCDMVKKELTPAINKSMERLFSDTRDIFRDGVKEVVGTVDNSNTKCLRSMENRLMDALVTNQSKFLSEFDVNLKRLQTDVSNSRVSILEGISTTNNQVLRVADGLHRIQDQLTDASKKNDLIMGGGHAGGSMMNLHHSSSASAADQLMMREQKISRLLSVGDHAAALNEALSLTNLRVLLSVCSRIKPRSVLVGTSQKPAPLQVSSVLSLIQQISREFNEQFDIKYEYLFEAILNLNHDSPGMQDYLTKVLRGVSRRLQTFIDQEDNAIVGTKDKLSVILRLVTSKLETLNDN